MKKAEWQAVYAPRGDALERRVQVPLPALKFWKRIDYRSVLFLRE